VRVYLRSRTKQSLSAIFLLRVKGAIIFLLHNNFFKIFVLNLDFQRFLKIVDVRYVLSNELESFVFIAYLCGSGVFFECFLKMLVEEG
jgi:hypothetical protein